MGGRAARQAARKAWGQALFAIESSLGSSSAAWPGSAGVSPALPFPPGGSRYNGLISRRGQERARRPRSQGCDKIEINPVQVGSAQRATSCRRQGMILLRASPETVMHDWKLAKAWLLRAMS